MSSTIEKIRTSPSNYSMNQITLRTHFNLKRKIFIFGPNLPKKDIPVQNRMIEHQIQHNLIILGVTFCLNRQP